MFLFVKVLNISYYITIIIAGKIPLHQLVYRILVLPSIKQTLVYDFKQLKNDTEGDYIEQIVNDLVREWRYNITLHLHYVGVYRLHAIPPCPNIHTSLHL